LAKVSSNNLANAVLCAKIIPSLSSINERTVSYSNPIKIIKLGISSTSD
jgi:hypothetical protein